MKMYFLQMCFSTNIITFHQGPLIPSDIFFTQIPDVFSHPMPPFPQQSPLSSLILFFLLTPLFLTMTSFSLYDVKTLKCRKASERLSYPGIKSALT
jgi:hypothetical protein